jgi:hypothetical protein
MKSDWCTPRSLSALSDGYQSVSSGTTPRTNRLMKKAKSGIDRSRISYYDAPDGFSDQERGGAR